MKMRIDFESLYGSLTGQFVGNQKRINISSALAVYYGISGDNYLRLAFRSSVVPPKLESTQLLRVEQGKEGDNIYWTCFDLLSHEARAAFFAFCQNMVEVVVETETEKQALNRLKKRFISWKALFKKKSTKAISVELIQGLFGELYFLNNYMAEKYGITSAVSAWGGPESTSKDFAIGTDWYEIKTIGTSAACVKISSLAQLSSDMPGVLAILRAERMPNEFSNGQSSIAEMISIILEQTDDEAVESMLLSKIALYGISVTDESFAMKFDIKSLKRYSVKNGFPRITISDVPYTEINNVSYEISVAAINQFLED